MQNLQSIDVFSRRLLNNFVLIYLVYIKLLQLGILMPELDFHDFIDRTVKQIWRNKCILNVVGNQANIPRSWNKDKSKILSGVGKFESLIRQDYIYVNWSILVVTKCLTFPSRRHRRLHGRTMWYLYPL